MNKILIAVDESPFAEAAIASVLKPGWQSDTEYKILHVVQPPDVMDGLAVMYGYSEQREIISDRTKVAQKFVEKLAGELAKQLKDDSLVSSEVIIGQPKEVIIDMAEKWPADMIVMGSHGRGGVARFVLGSVSLSVLSQAPCSVAIVRLPSAAEAAKGKEEATGAKEPAGKA